MLGKPVDIDSESGAQIHLVGADNRPTDNIYGEQPYADTTGRWIAIRHFPESGQQDGISIIDLKDGLRRDVLVGDPRFPAFHAWGDYLYYQQMVDRKLMLRRTRYDTPKTEDITLLPSERGTFSYGTVSPDHRYYVVCVMEKKGDRIFFSTASDPDSTGNIWSVKISEPQATLVCPGKQCFDHVSVSRCGRYWIGDTSEEGIPIYIGRFGSGTCRRIVHSRTVYDGKQWSHAHPYLTADNEWLIFNSSRNGHAQVYGAKLAPGWLDES